MCFGFRKFLKYFFFSFIFLPLLAHAWSLPNSTSLSAQIGASQLHLGSSTLQVTPTETDTLNKSNNIWAPEFSLGVNYQLPLCHKNSYGMTWFPYLVTAINLRYMRQKISGDVYQYQESLMDNYTYTLKVSSLRLMFNIILPVLAFQEKTTLYLLGGFGDSWTQVSYSDTPIPSVQGGALSLHDRTTTGFVYELGGGIFYPIDKFMAVFLEYRYAHFPMLKTGTRGTLNGMGTNIPSAAFPFDSQTLSFGFNWNL